MGEIAIIKIMHLGETRGIGVDRAGQLYNFLQDKEHPVEVGKYYKVTCYYDPVMIVFNQEVKPEKKF